MHSNYKKVKDLSATEAAYIAGIIDGEGTIALSKKHANDYRHLVVSISNTDFSLLEYIKDTVGAGKITKKKTYKDRHTASRNYTITNRQALALLEQIFTYLKTYKYKRAKLILENYIKLTPRNGKYKEETLKLRENFILDVMNLKPID